MQTYKDAPDLNVKKTNDLKGQNHRGKRLSENSKRNNRLEAYDTKRFSINIGRVHKVNSGAIVRLICENCNVKSNQIGSINLGKEASVFEVSKEISTTLRKGMENVNLNGRKVVIRASKDYKSNRTKSGRNRANIDRRGKKRSIQSSK